MEVSTFFIIFESNSIGRNQISVEVNNSDFVFRDTMSFLIGLFKQITPSRTIVLRTSTSAIIILFHQNALLENYQLTNVLLIFRVNL